MITIPAKQLKNGFTMPVYGLGTWQMGGQHSYNLDNNDEADITAIKTAIDEGITHIDTAESYAEGYAEKLLGKAIKDYDRSKLFLVSKVAPAHLRYDDLIRSAKASLQRIGTSYLDLYLIHRFSPEISLKETMRAMDTLLKQGLTKQIGVCNFNVARLQEAQSYTNNKIVANQVHLNLRYREAEKKGIVKYCQENDIFFIAWRPLQKGMLVNEKFSILTKIADKYHKTPAQIALNWLISQDHIITLSKTRDQQHLEENLGAVGWTLKPEDIEILRQQFPNQEYISDTIPLD